MKNSNSVWSAGGDYHKMSPRKEAKQNVGKCVCASYRKAGFQISKGRREFMKNSSMGL